MYKIKIIVKILLLLILSANLLAQADEQKFNLAQGYEKGGDITAALRLYEEIYQKNKAEKYFEPIVRIYKQQNRFEELKPFIDERLKTHNSAKLLILNGEINWRLGNTSEANVAWEKAKKDFGKDLTTYLDLTATLNTLRLFDKSVTVLLEAKQKFTNNVVIIDGLLRVYTVMGNYQDGFREVLYFLSLTKNLQQTQGKLFGFMVSDEANNFIAQSFNREIKRSEDLQLLSLYGWFLRANQNFAQAFEIFQQIDEIKYARGSEIYKFAEESRRDGEFDIALKAFKTIIDMGKNSSLLNSAIYSYTKTMEEKLSSKSSITKEDAASIIKSYQSIAKDFPKTDYSEQSKMRIAYLERNVLKNNKNAVAALQSIIETKLNANYVVQAMNELSEIYLASGDIFQANTTISTMLKQYKAQSSRPEIATALNQGKFNQAEILYYSGKTDSALSIYYELAKSLDADIANDALARISFIEQNKDFVKALSLFSQAEYFQLQGRNSEALSNFYEVIKIGAGEQIGEIATIRTAELEIEKNDLSKARKLLETYISDNIYPMFGDKALFILGNIAEKSNNNSEAIDFYVSILEKYPRSILISEARKKIRTLRQPNS